MKTFFSQADRHQAGMAACRRHRPDPSVASPRKSPCACAANGHLNAAWIPVTSSSYQRWKKSASPATRPTKDVFPPLGFPGGIYETNFEKLQAKYPDRVLKNAVRGMLPKGPPVTRCSKAKCVTPVTLTRTPRAAIRKPVRAL